METRSNTRKRKQSELTNTPATEEKSKKPIAPFKRKKITNELDNYSFSFIHKLILKLPTASDVANKLSIDETTLRDYLEEKDTSYEELKKLPISTAETHLQSMYHQPLTQEAIRILKNKRSMLFNKVNYPTFLYIVHISRSLEQLCAILRVSNQEIEDYLIKNKLNWEGLKNLAATSPLKKQHQPTSVSLSLPTSKTCYQQEFPKVMGGEFGIGFNHFSPRPISRAPLPLHPIAYQPQQPPAIQYPGYPQPPHQSTSRSAYNGSNPTLFNQPPAARPQPYYQDLNQYVRELDKENQRPSTHEANDQPDYTLGVLGPFQR